MKNMIINFTYRSKFEKLIKNDVERQTFTAAFNKFFDLTPEKARHFLWRLTYNDQVARKALAEVGLDFENFSSEKIRSIRNEMRHQYLQLRPYFLAVTGLPEECREAFEDLKKNTDDIVANAVYLHCTYRLHEHDAYMSNLLGLLSNEKDNKNFGGISSLYFGRPETEYLLPHHLRIHNLLQAMYEHYRNQCSPAPLNTPFAGLDKKLAEKGFDLPFDFGPNKVVNAPAAAKQAEPVHTSSAFKAITPENVLEHRDVFSAFAINRDMACLSELSKLGFDLNQIVAKVDTISDLLNATVSKEEADASVAKATQIKEEADAALAEATRHQEEVNAILLKAAEALSK